MPERFGVTRNQAITLIENWPTQQPMDLSAPAADTRPDAQLALSIGDRSEVRLC